MGAQTTTNQSEIQNTHLQMQTQLLDNVNERRNEQKRKLQVLLEAQVKLAPTTPHTARSGGSATVPRYKRVENFIGSLFGEQMVTENWVSNYAQNDAKHIKQQSKNFWYQISREGKLIKHSEDKSDNCQHLEYFRDLGPVQRSILHKPE